MPAKRSSSAGRDSTRSLAVLITFVLLGCAPVAAQDEGPAGPAPHVAPGPAANGTAGACNDCAEVKRAIRAARAGEGGRHHRKKIFSGNRMFRLTGRTRMTMRRLLHRGRKNKATYEVCFRWG